MKGKVSERVFLKEEWSRSSLTWKREGKGFRKRVPERGEVRGSLIWKWKGKVSERVFLKEKRSGDSLTWKREGKGFRKSGPEKGVVEGSTVRHDVCTYINCSCNLDVEKYSLKMGSFF